MSKYIALWLCILLATGSLTVLTLREDRLGTDNEEANGEVKGNLALEGQEVILPTPIDSPAYSQNQMVQTTGTRGDPIFIHTIDDLQNMSNDLTAHYVLANDIDGSATREWNDGAGFEPIGSIDAPYEGTFEGHNFTVTELFIHRPSTDHVGLFGLVSRRGSVRNVGLVDVDITGNDRTGGAIGKSSGSVSHCYTLGSVSGYRVVGGLIGYNDAGSVASCFSKASVTGTTDYSGGLIGYNSANLVSNSYATGCVSGTGRIGGLVGANYGSVERCYASGSVSGTNWVGGLVGYSFRASSVENSHATGVVTRSSGTATALGGFLGRNYQATVINCYSTGPVQYNGTPDPMNKGFCGEVDSGGGTYRMSGNFWDTKTSGQTSTSGGATGKTTSEMRTTTTFTRAGWDFDHVWWMIPDMTYPLLQWPDTEPPVAHAGPDQTVNEGEKVIFNGSASIDYVGIANYTWTFHDGTGNISLYGLHSTHTFSVPGVIVVKLNATNSIGLTNTDTLTVTVKKIAPPVAHAGSDQTVEEGTEVIFDGGSSISHVGTLYYIWYFNDGIDGVFLSGVAPSHLFTVPGEYTVTLVVVDTTGKIDTDTLNITVNGIIFTLAHMGPDRILENVAEVEFGLSSSPCHVDQSMDDSWYFNDDMDSTIPSGVAPTCLVNIPEENTVTLVEIDQVRNEGTNTIPIAPQTPEADRDEVINVIPWFLVSMLVVVLLMLFSLIYCKRFMSLERLTNSRKGAR